MANLPAGDVAIGYIEHVPARHTIKQPRAEQRAHYRGAVDRIVQTDMSSDYRMADEGHAPIEVTADTREECEALLRRAIEMRGWSYIIEPDEPVTDAMLYQMVQAATDLEANQKMHVMLVNASIHGASYAAVGMLRRLPLDLSPAEQRAWLQGYDGARAELGMPERPGSTSMNSRSSGNT